MVRLKLQPTVPPMPHWWHPLGEIVGFSARQSKIFWRALSASQNARLRGLRYRCDAFDQQLGQDIPLREDTRRLDAFLKGVWSCHAMCSALEILHREHLLTRVQCSAFEERFLICADRDGNWIMR